MAADTPPSVHQMIDYLQTLLEKASEIKSAGSLDPPLTPSSFGDSIDQIKSSGTTTLQHASTESAFRSLFYNFLVRAEQPKDEVTSLNL
jgi:hypothetical protein